MLDDPDEDVSTARQGSLLAMSTNASFIGDTDIGVNNWATFKPRQMLEALGITQPRGDLWSFPFFRQDGDKPRWHQLVGIAELVKRAFTPSYQPGTCSNFVLDAVGLGKTCQALGVIAYLCNLVHLKANKAKWPSHLSGFSSSHIFLLGSNMYDGQPEKTSPGRRNPNSYLSTLTLSFAPLGW